MPDPKATPQEPTTPTATGPVNPAHFVEPDVDPNTAPLPPDFDVYDEGQTETEEEIRTVVIDGKTWQLKGRADANVISASFMMPDATRIALKRHIKAVGKFKGQVSDIMVGNVVLVQRMLVPPDPQKPFDIPFVAKLARNKGHVFMRLLKEATAITKMDQVKGDDDVDPLLEFAVGNSAGCPVGNVG